MDQGIHEAVSRPRCSAVGTAVALAAGLVEGAANSLPMDCNTGRNSVSVPELWLCFAVPLSFSSFEDEGRCLGHLHSFRASRSQVKQGDGTWRANPPFFSGNGPNGQALPHCGTCSSLRGAFDVLPVAELLVVDARTSAACPRQLSTKSTSQERKWLQRPRVLPRVPLQMLLAKSEAMRVTRQLGLPPRYRRVSI